LVWVVLVGILAGWLAGQITKGRGFGILGNLIVGILRSLLGSFLFGLRTPGGEYATAHNGRF
jgi:uncharacterized membrane protein YeaQ/YmgE (transglycosylase-associated protein family)